MDVSIYLFICFVLSCFIFFLKYIINAVVIYLIRNVALLIVLLL